MRIPTLTHGVLQATEKIKNLTALSSQKIEEKKYTPTFLLNFMQKILILLCIVLILAPIPFLKIHDDEVIYWSIAKSYSELKPKFFGRMLLPMLIVAPFLRINENFLVPRFIAGIFTLLSAYLICRIISLRYGEGCIEGALIFLFSFYALRFGNRFYLDIFGTFFFLLAIYFIEKNEMEKAGVSSVLAILGRDLWIPIYPFFYIYLRREGKDIKKFALTSLILILPTITIVYLMGLERYALLRFLKISYYNISSKVCKGYNP